MPLDRSCGSNNIVPGVFISLRESRIQNTIFESNSIRNRVPWAIIVAINFTQIILVMILRAYLVRQNAIRNRASENGEEKPENADEKEEYNEAFVVVQDANGRDVKKRVHRAFMDLTDRQNKEFRYVL